MIVFPAQVLASVEHILQLLVGCIIDLSSEHLLIFCHLSLFLFSLCLFDCAEDSSHSASFRSSSVPLSYPLGGCRRSIWERGERYKGTSICRYLLDVPFHISPFGVEGGPGRGKLTLRLLRSRGGRSIAHCK